MCCTCTCEEQAQTPETGGSAAEKQMSTPAKSTPSCSCTRGFGGLVEPRPERNCEFEPMGWSTLCHSGERTPGAHELRNKMTRSEATRQQLPHGFTMPQRGGNTKRRARVRKPEPRVQGKCENQQRPLCRGTPSKRLHQRGRCGASSPSIIGFLAPDLGLLPPTGRRWAANPS